MLKNSKRKFVRILAMMLAVLTAITSTPIEAHANGTGNTTDAGGNKGAGKKFKVGVGNNYMGWYRHTQGYRIYIINSSPSRPRRYIGSRDQREKAVRQHASSWSRELPCAHGRVPMSGTITSWEHLPNIPQPRINPAPFWAFSLSHFPTAFPIQINFSKIFFKSTVKIPLKILIFRENFFSNLRKENRFIP